MKNTEKFTGKAEVYAKYRPGYPEALISHLIKAYSPGPAATVADIGSGTGIFTKHLLDAGMRAIAVEPNADMRIAAEKELSAYPNFTSIDGTAEDTTLPDRSVDLVTSAQAFHWFNRASFRKECERILRKNGFVALIWNNRADSDPLMMENAEICRKHCPAFNGFSGARTHDGAIFRDFFRDGIYEELAFPHDLRLDLASFIGRNLSASYAPTPEMFSRTPFIEALTQLFRKYEQAGEIRMPNTTRCYAGQV